MNIKHNLWKDLPELLLELETCVEMLEYKGPCEANVLPEQMYNFEFL